MEKLASVVRITDIIVIFAVLKLCLLPQRETEVSFVLIIIQVLLGKIVV